MEQVDLGAGGLNFDFTDASKTGKEVLAAFKAVIDVMWITNNCEKEMTVYVSREIASTWDQLFFGNESGSTVKTIEEMARVQGVAAIKTTNKMTGNEMMGFPLDGMAVRPISGMGMSTFALPRPLYNSNHEFVVASATGWMVNQDYFGQTCTFYAADLT